MNSVIAFPQPFMELFIKVIEINKFLAVKKGANITDDPLNAPFFIAFVRITQVNREAIEPGKV